MRFYVWNEIAHVTKMKTILLFGWPNKFIAGVGVKRKVWISQLAHSIIYDGNQKNWVIEAITKNKKFNVLFIDVIARNSYFLWV